MQLHEGEEILLSTKPNPGSALYFLFTRMWHFLLIIIAVGYFFIAHLPQDKAAQNGTNATQMGNNIIPIIIYLVVILLILLIAWFIIRKAITSYNYTFTNQRCIIEFGFFSLGKRIIPYGQVNDIDFSSSFVERLFGYGSVYIDDLSTALNNRGFGRSRNTNKTSRLEGLTLKQCEQVMDLVSSRISKLKTNQ